MLRPLKEALAELEWELIDKALAKTKGDVTDAAALLGVHRIRIYRRLEAYGINPDDYRFAKTKKKTKKKSASRRTAKRKTRGKKKQ